MYDIAYTYYATDLASNLEYIYIINNKGEYIKYKYKGVGNINGKPKETKRKTINKSLYKEMAY
jgi:hypothetical protein